MKFRALYCLGVWLGIAIAVPSHADWLITTEGESIQTRGAWEQKGGLIVFTRPDGTLASIRVKEIDLESSQAVTAEAKRIAALPPVPVEAPAPKRSIARLTERDLPPVRRPSAVNEEAVPQAPQLSRLGLSLVTSQQESPFDSEGLVFTGQFRNDSNGLVAAITARVVLFDAAGQVQAEVPAQVHQGALGPGEESSFEAQFPSVYNYDRYEVRFDGMPLAARQPGPAEPAAPAEGAAPDIETP